MLIFGVGFNKPKAKKKKCGCGGKCKGNCTCGARKPNNDMNNHYRHMVT